MGQAGCNSDIRSQASTEPRRWRGPAGPVADGGSLRPGQAWSPRGPSWAEREPPGPSAEALRDSCQQLGPRLDCERNQTPLSAFLSQTHCVIREVSALGRCLDGGPEAVCEWGMVGLGPSLAPVTPREPPAGSGGTRNATGFPPSQRVCELPSEDRVSPSPRSRTCVTLRLPLTLPGLGSLTGGGALLGRFLSPGLTGDSFPSPSTRRGRPVLFLGPGRLPPDAGRAPGAGRVCPRPQRGPGDGDQPLV